MVGLGQESSLPAGCSTEPKQSLPDDAGLDLKEPTITGLETEQRVRDRQCVHDYY